MFSGRYTQRTCAAMQRSASQPAYAVRSHVITDTSAHGRCAMLQAAAATPQQVGWKKVVVYKASFDERVRQKEEGVAGRGEAGAAGTRQAVSRSAVGGTLPRSCAYSSVAHEAARYHRFHAFSTKRQAAVAGVHGRYCKSRRRSAT